VALVSVVTLLPVVALVSVVTLVLVVSHDPGLHPPADWNVKNRAMRGRS